VQRTRADPQSAGDADQGASSQGHTDSEEHPLVYFSASNQKPGVSVAGMLQHRSSENSRGPAIPTAAPIRATAPTQRVAAAAEKLSRLLSWITDRARTSRMANWRAVSAARTNPNRSTLAFVIPSVARRMLPATARRVPTASEADQCSLRKMMARTTDHTGTVPSMMAERDGPTSGGETSTIRQTPPLS
jgi:hypothetical protein